jgi:hypothetical protein
VDLNLLLHHHIPKHEVLQVGSYLLSDEAQLEHFLQLLIEGGAEQLCHQLVLILLLFVLRLCEAVDLVVDVLVFFDLVGEDLSQVEQVFLDARRLIEVDLVSEELETLLDVAQLYLRSLFGLGD